MDDGLFAIYRIQHCDKKSGKWIFSNLGHFGYPEGFNADRECWQETGVHGTLDRAEGERGLEWIRKVNTLAPLDSGKKILFRLVCVITSQKTLVCKETGW